MALKKKMKKKKNTKQLILTLCLSVFCSSNGAERDVKKKHKITKINPLPVSILQ